MVAPPQDLGRKAMTLHSRAGLKSALFHSGTILLFIAHGAHSYSERRVDAQLCAELEALPPLVAELHLDLLLHDALVQQDDQQDAGAPDHAHVGGGGDEARRDGHGHGDVEGDHDGEGEKR